MQDIRIAISFILVGVLFASPVYSGGNKPGGKPALPVDVVIQPVSNVPAGGYYRSGDICDLEVRVTALARAKVLRIKVSLTGGVDLVQGDLAWNGAVEQGEERVLNISVKVPASGKGRIRATATLLRENARPVKSTAEYEILIEQRTEKSKQRSVKDDKGRNIIEY